MDGRNEGILSTDVAPRTDCQKPEPTLNSRVGQFDFRPASFLVHNSAVSGRTTLKFGMGPYDSPVELVSKFGVNRTSLTMRVELGSNLQSQRKRVELSNPTEQCYVSCAADFRETREHAD